jgi:hypothetical protein
MTMCRETNCQHVKFNPNKTATLTTEDLSALWSDIKSARKALEARQSFLQGLEMDQATIEADDRFIKLSGLLAGLWTRFRVL